jgi:hypothetical protein
MKQEQEASGVWTQRKVEARKHDTAQPEVEEPEFAEAAE